MVYVHGFSELNGDNSTLSLHHFLTTERTLKTEKIKFLYISACGPYDIYGKGMGTRLAIGVLCIIIVSL